MSLIARLTGSTLALAMLAGCSADKPAEPAQSAETSQSAEPQSYPPSENPGDNDAPEAEAEPADPVDTSSWVYSSSFTPDGYAEDGAVVTGLRVAEHDGYDRVVIDLTSDGPVGWDARYTDNPTSQGKGDTIPVPGKVFLDVAVTRASIPITDEHYAVYYEGGTPVPASVVTAWYDSTFEGRAHVVIGMDAERPFNIFTLTNPLRVVIDIDNS